MQCREAQELLSAYYDGELPAESLSSLAAHVEGCPRCGEELAGFGDLSAMAKGLGDPEPPRGIWTGIEAALDADSQGVPTERRGAARKRGARKWLGLFATAALVLVTTGVVWFTFGPRQPPGRDRALAADFSEYLERFPENPERAQQVLLAKYDGQAVGLSQAVHRTGYRPAVADGLPERYTLDGMYVLDMPCCTCVQAICRRDDGKVFAIFEHVEEQPAWLGARPRRDTQCHGCACSVIAAERGVVASWKGGKRHLTVVGADDVEEIADLISHLHRRGNT